MSSGSSSSGPRTTRSTRDQPWRFRHCTTPRYYPKCQRCHHWKTRNGKFRYYRRTRAHLCQAFASALVFVHLEDEKPHLERVCKADLTKTMTSFCYLKDVVHKVFSWTTAKDEHCHDFFHVMMNGVGPIVSDQQRDASLRREAWGGGPTTPNVGLVCSYETSSSNSSDEVVRPTTTTRTVGLRFAQAAAATSIANPVHHVHVHHKRRRRSTGEAQTGAYLEIQNVMGLVQKKFFRAVTWLDALQVIRLVVSNCLAAVICAWVTVVVYAFGSPWSPFMPKWSSIWSAPVFTASNLTTATEQFNAVVGFYFVMIACIAHLLAKSFTVGNRLFTFSAGMWSLDPNAPGFRRLLGRNFVATGMVLVVAVGGGSSIMELLRFFDINFRADGRMHLYILSFISYGYILYAEVFLRFKLLRRIRRSLVFLRTASVTPLVEIGPAQPAPLDFVPIKSRNDKPHRFVALSELMRQLLRAQVLPVVTFHTVFLFLHVAAALSLQERWQATLFAGASQVLKVALQEAAKKLQLSNSRQRHSARMVHTVMTVPTIFIDAPVRLVFMQKGVESSSIVSSSLAIIVFEVLFRMTKIMWLRYVVSARLARSRIIKRVLHRVNSRLEGRDLVRARAEYSRFLDWKHYKLRLHAAEVYADMHGKYISIGLAVGMLYMLRSHPRFELGYMSSSTHIQLLGAVMQIAAGFAADVVACAFEGIQEVPMYESLIDEGTPLLHYLRLLMAVLTTVNVGVIALFAMK